MKRLTAISFTMTLSALVLAGCGGGSGINSGVDSSKPANELSDEEIEQVCEATIDYVDQQVDQQDIGCKSTALVAGILALAGGDDAMQEACTDAYEACLEVEPEPGEDTTCSDASDTGVDENCDSTVGEIETCMADSVDAIAAASDEIPDCSELTVDSLDDLAMTPEFEEPESCEALDDSCPSFTAG